MAMRSNPPTHANKQPAFCCAMMAYHATLHCPDHTDPFACPDQLIHFNPDTRYYGLIIHDGGEASVAIHHCPWCGKKL